VRVKPRLIKLEVALPKGCDACRNWGEVVLVDHRATTRQPEPCTGCGRLVAIRTVVHLVGVRLDLV